MTFNENLMNLRKTRGMSQEELGDKLNVTRQTVSKWELGQTTPEMEKLIELSKLFGMSIDELVGNAEVKPPPMIVYPYKWMHYEYKSKTHIFGLPLVHVNLGVGIKRAKGIIAVGTVAQGVIAIGPVSIGLISFGALALGIIALGAFSVGLMTFGGIAVGAIAFGGVAVGIYSLGGCAIAYRIAMGGFACGHIAIGDSAAGEYAWNHISQLQTSDFADIRERILTEYPNIWKWILHLFA